MLIIKPIVAPRFLKLLSKINGFGISGFFFFPFIFINRPEPSVMDNDHRVWRKTVRHESIHWQQCVETLIIGFLLIYGGHYLLLRLNGKDHEAAYRGVVFEREAYTNQWDEIYHKRRVWFAWLACFNDC
ncbi:hypothetical protein [Reichenbachiella sp.]|uniref:hypothetical protein n=1 Tax=Reichenbachiella sp. TaxID=2184521 RepID=UPI003B59D865